jgi:hypothetical protein
MYSIEIPGIGEVEVENDRDLQALKNQLDAHYKKMRDESAKVQAVPGKILEALESLRDSQEKLMKAMVAGLKEIKPSVSVEAPVVNYTPPEVVVNVPAPVVNVQSPKESARPTISVPIRPITSLDAEVTDTDWRGHATKFKISINR